MTLWKGNSDYQKEKYSKMVKDRKKATEKLVAKFKGLKIKPRKGLTIEKIEQIKAKLDAAGIK